MTSKEAYNYLLGLLESGGDMRWSLVKESMDKFKELIEQQSNSTLSDCIKEWEDRGYETIYHEKHIIFRHHKTYKVIEIDSINLSYKTDEWYDPKRPYADRLNIDEIQYITLDLHNLINKTIKALEVEKCEK